MMDETERDNESQAHESAESAEAEAAEHAEAPTDAELLARLSSQLDESITRMAQVETAIADLRTTVAQHLENETSAASHTHEPPAELLVLIDAVKEVQGSEQAPVRRNWFHRKVWG